LGAAAAQTSRIALATGVITLPLDDPLRVAEDAAVLDQLSGGRVQLGLATGGTPSSFPAFGRSSDDRRQIFADHFEVVLDALAGRGIRGTDSRIYPAGGDLSRRIWQATFSVDGGRRAGERGDGLLLSRTQPKPDGAALHEVQLPIIEAYRTALPQGASVRVLASRTAVVVDEENRAEAIRLADEGLRTLAASMFGVDAAELPFDELARLTDTHIGTVDEVVASLSQDETLQAVSDVSFQVHSVAATHELTLRSLELLATEVAPRLGIAVGAADELRTVHLETA
ncbi:MAG: LLM class flavin-dependent oxidoreductase, partial [Microbacterium sp.]